MKTGAGRLAAEFEKALKGGRAPCSACHGTGVERYIIDEYTPAEQRVRDGQPCKVCDLVSIPRAVVKDALILLRVAARLERPNASELAEPQKATYCPGCEESPTPAYHTACVPKLFRRKAELGAAKFVGGPGPRPCDGSCNPGGPCGCPTLADL